jgi:hypothetical protein
LSLHSTGSRRDAGCVAKLGSAVQSYAMVRLAKRCAAN